MIILYLHAKFHIHNSSGLLIITATWKLHENFHRATAWWCDEPSCPVPI